MANVCPEPMIILDLDGIEVDYCLETGGIWLDEGELELLMQLKGASSGELMQVINNATVLRKSDKNCPRCGKKMDLISIAQADETPVELERCPKRHGLWFDKGELQTVVNLSRTEEGKILSDYLTDLFKHQLQETNS